MKNNETFDIKYLKAKVGDSEQLIMQLTPNNKQMAAEADLDSILVLNNGNGLVLDIDGTKKRISYNDTKNLVSHFGKSEDFEELRKGHYKQMIETGGLSVSEVIRIKIEEAKEMYPELRTRMSLGADSLFAGVKERTSSLSQKIENSSILKNRLRPHGIPDIDESFKELNININQNDEVNDEVKTSRKNGKGLKR